MLALALTQYRRDTDMVQIAVLPCFAGLRGRFETLLEKSVLTVACTVPQVGWTIWYLVMAP
ncbi:MAG: hypothetical protein ACFB11_01870 [Paracoccaceae bacterium]